MKRLSDRENFLLHYIVIGVEGKSRWKVVFLYAGVMIWRYQAFLIAAYFVDYYQEVVRKMKHSFGRLSNADQSTISRTTFLRKF